MCGISDLDDAGGGRGPARLGVAPEELKVDNGVWGSDVDKVFEDGSPLVDFHASHFVHALKNFFFFNGVVPVLFLGAGDLPVN